MYVSVPITSTPTISVYEESDDTIRVEIDTVNDTIGFIGTRDGLSDLAVAIGDALGIGNV